MPTQANYSHKLWQGDLIMAKWMEVTATELFELGDCVLWTGLSDTVTSLELDTADQTRGVVIKKNSRGKTLWKRAVVKGNHCYRINANGVRRLPMVENDPDIARRLCRTLGWPMTWIHSASAEEKVFFGPPRTQGEANYRNGYRWLEAGQKIVVESCWTLYNPEWVYGIIVSKDNPPTNWEEAALALRTLVMEDGLEEELPSLEEAIASLKL